MSLTQKLLLPALALATVMTPASAAVAQDGDRFAYQAPNGGPMSFADLIEQVSPAVVSIEARTAPGERAGPDLSEMPPQFREFFERFGGLPDQRQPRERRAQGSGFFISADGYVVTNNHVIEGAEDITVALSDGRDFQAVIVGTDPETDLALLRVEADAPFAFVDLERDLDIRVGDWVVAMGNPFGLGGSATTGIISAMGRQIGPAQAYTDFLQTDASINRGNSGGPMFDLDGNVVGVNSAILSPTGGNVGIGFAIPSDLAAQVIEQLISNGEVRRGYLGVAPGDLTDELKDAMGLAADLQGALINQVLAGTPAEDAGLENGDVVLEVNGRAVEDARDLTRTIGAVQPGEVVRLLVLRGERERTIRVTLGDRPDQDAAPAGPSLEPGQISMFGMVLQAPDEEDRERLALDGRGLVIASVEPGSQAAAKGLRTGDAILEAGGRDVRTVEDFRDASDDARARGRQALLVFVGGQGGQRRYAALELPEEE
jgi:serine protease Do